jgi:hypothetical protein
VIDLLAVRSAESFAEWLGSHPEVELITRDRSSLYAEGGRQGAPAAVQITDRYHLVTNLGEAVERDIQQLQIEARADLTRNRLPKNKEAHADRSALAEMPASTIRPLPGGPRTPPSRSHSAGYRGEGWNHGGHCIPVVECTGVSRAPNTKRSATRPGPLPAGSGVRIAAITHSNSLFGRPYRSSSEQTTKKAFAGAGAAFGGILSIVPEGSQAAPVRSPVSSHAEMAERSETFYLGRGGYRFSISIPCSICENAAPRLASPSHCGNRSGWNAEIARPHESLLITPVVMQVDNDRPTDVHYNGGVPAFSAGRSPSN